MKEEHNHYKDAFSTDNEAEAAYGFSIWLGAVFYHCINLGKIPFNDLYSEKYRRRNVWTGYFLHLIFALLFFGSMLYLYSYI